MPKLKLQMKFKFQSLDKEDFDTWKFGIYKKHLLNTAQLCWADENRFAKR